MITEATSKIMLVTFRIVQIPRFPSSVMSDHVTTGSSKLLTIILTFASSLSFVWKMKSLLLPIVAGFPEIICVNILICNFHNFELCWISFTQQLMMSPVKVM